MQSKDASYMIWKKMFQITVRFHITCILFSLYIVLDVNGAQCDKWSKQIDYASLQ
jgi:hypothetical protein